MPGPLVGRSEHAVASAAGPPAEPAHHPLALGRQAADLPPATTLMSQSDLERDGRRRDTEDLVEVSGAGLAGDRTAAVHFAAGIGTVAVAKPGDARWTAVDRGRDLSPSPAMS
ncbi:hypothetical protein C2845_PM04G29860 [Panicum miliaceum]|uniref:Uncharacterized protein n=1 Tax=Panicum miliaceum TaxID=4540 RepID=A0A3L6QV58_PANMI|nr:hypothetical protein C2845_PM04G29860 [Panicum miliaceum]